MKSLAKQQSKNFDVLTNRSLCKNHIYKKIKSTEIPHQHFEKSKFGPESCRKTSITYNKFDSIAKDDVLPKLVSVVSGDRNFGWPF